MSYGQPVKSKLRALSRKQQILIIAGIAVALALLLMKMSEWATQNFTPPLKAESPVQAADTFRPTKDQWASFQIMTVQAMSFQTELVTDGNIANNEDTTSPVFSPYSGRVSKLISKLGDVVKKGAPLMMVEASDFIQARNNLVAAIVAFNAASSQFQFAQATEQRQHELYLSKAGALKDWQQSQSDLTAAQNNFDTNQSILGNARDQLRILGNSDGEIDAIEHDPDRQKMNPGAYVLAPISGTITQRQVGLGQYITSAAAGASTPVYTISNLSTVWLIANVRETDASKIRVGQPVEVTVTAYPGRQFKARIAWVASAVDPNTHRLPVRAEVQNPNLALKPMMFASFKIGIDKEVPAPGVPQSAVVYEGSDAHVWVARDNGTVVSRPVHIGRTNNGMAEITAGLTPGEKVVTSGTLFIDRASENENQ